MTEPVSPPYKLPNEVLRLLGDDATPERAATRQEAFLGACLAKGEIDQMPDVLALGAYDSALAAAAIRECEARRAWDAYVSSRHMSRDDGVAAQRACKETGDAYDALRNWMKV